MKKICAGMNMCKRKGKAMQERKICNRKRMWVCNAALARPETPLTGLSQSVCPFSFIQPLP